MSDNTIYLTLVAMTILLPLVPAVIIYRFLPSRTFVTGPFKGLNVQLSGAFAGYFILVLVMAGFITTRPKTYEVWTIKGKAVMANAGDTLVESDISVRPNNVAFLGDGSFTLDIPVRRNQAGKLDFPTLVVHHDGYESVYIPLGDKRYAFGGPGIKVETDKGAKTKLIAEQIRLQRSSVPYMWGTGEGAAQ